MNAYFNIAMEEFTLKRSYVIKKKKYKEPSEKQNLKILQTFLQTLYLDAALF